MYMKTFVNKLWEKSHICISQKRNIIIVLYNIIVHESINGVHTHRTLPFYFYF